MKTFDDIKFRPHPNGSGIYGTLKINEYTLSVVAGLVFYSSPKLNLQSSDEFDSFEVAVWDDKKNWVTHKFFDTCFNNDVQGWLNRDDINKLISEL